MKQGWVRPYAALLGASGIAAAAFGAHGLEKLTDSQGIRWWAIGAAIQLATAPVVLWSERLVRDSRLGSIPALLLAAGVALFSGSLYALALGAPRLLGAVTPFGGLFLIAGWLSLAWPSH